MIEDRLQGEHSHQGFSSHDPERVPHADRLEQEDRAELGAEALENEVWTDDAQSRMGRMEERFRRLEQEEERLLSQGGPLLDPMTSHCVGCGKIRPLWELDLVRVPTAELPTGAPLTLRMVCKAHGVPAVAAPAHQWERVDAPHPSREERDAEALRRIDDMITELGGTEALMARRATREFPPVRPLPKRVPEKATVGFWRRVTGRQGRVREA